MGGEIATRPMDDFKRAYRARIEQAGPGMRLTDDVARVESRGAVMSFVEPHSPRFEGWRDSRDADEQVCPEQTLCPSPRAAAARLAGSAGGGLVPVREFAGWTRPVWPSWAEPT